MYDHGNATNNQFPIILFAKPHSLDELLAIKVCMSGAKCNSGKMQPQVVKCREFIFTEPDVIGTPSSDINDHSFHLVAQISLMNSGKIQNRLSRIGLQTTTPYPVSTELYQSCLRYTLQARLSPSWNKAGQWLVQGRDFLTHKGCANAVKIDVTFIHNELFFTLEATVLKLSPLHVTDLDITPKRLENFILKTHSQISHEHILSDWCYVLPSMKRGRIVTISHEIPEESLFRTYRDLKRHWKNTYGYRLPENEDDVSFYQVHFGPLGGKLFTYPEVCLRGRELQKMARIDPKPILRTFIQDLQSRFPTVCGCPIKLQSKAKFAVSKLYSGNQVSTDNQPNLTTKLTGARPSLYRTKSEMETMFTNRPDKRESDVLLNNSSQKSPNKALVDVSRSTAITYPSNKTTIKSFTWQQRNPGSSNETCNINNLQPSQTPDGAGQSSCHGNTPSCDGQNTNQTSVARKLFPHFEPVKKQVQTVTVANNSTTKIVPQFRPKNKVMYKEPLQTKRLDIQKSQKATALLDSQSKTQTSKYTPSINLMAPNIQKAHIKTVLGASDTILQKETGTSKSKPKKRAAEKSKDGKNDSIIESKKLKKMRKAEA